MYTARSPWLAEREGPSLPGGVFPRQPAAQVSAPRQAVPQRSPLCSVPYASVSQPRYSQTPCHASAPTPTRAAMRVAGEVNQPSYGTRAPPVAQFSSSSGRTPSMSISGSVREVDETWRRSAMAETRAVPAAQAFSPLTRNISSRVSREQEEPRLRVAAAPSVMAPASQAQAPTCLACARDTGPSLPAPTQTPVGQTFQSRAGYSSRRAEPTRVPEADSNPSAQGVESASRVAFTKGSRVEALWNNDWYVGSVVSCPEEDPDGLGQWRVQCDGDDHGVYTASKRVREPTVDVEVEEVFCASDGKIWFVVFDRERNQLGAFGEEHLEFELTAEPATLRRWVSSVPIKLMPGLLALLASETRARKARLDYAEQEIRERYAHEDYAFFGLDEHCTDHALEQAYRRMSARLHPDKGGDVDAFAAMRQRYDRLRLLRSLANKERDAEAYVEVAEDDGGDQQQMSSGVDEAGNNGGRSEELTPEQEYRQCMLKIHDDLHLQLVWVSEQVAKVEKSLVDLMIRQSIRLCLMDGVSAEVSIEQLDEPESTIMQDEPPRGDQLPRPSASSNYPTSSASHARDHLGTCLICLEQLPADPSKVVNLCASEPRCLCLLHRNCYLNPDVEMSDQLRRCLICKGPADIKLVRQAVLIKSAPPEMPVTM
mmetsp:Transcript_61073/g.111877  ORF Transcript_61073/g.111877 Transcript_61073/m.111877 type:complete len:654 (-) Transcript_61073:104-2065(-)